MVQLRTLTVSLFGLIMMLAACGDSGPDDYDDSTREAFMAGCVEEDGDPDLVEVCECTYETAVEELPFERFRSVENRLQQGESDIPDDVSEIILDCIREVSASRS
ncbi:MAG: hypothetical protein ACLFRV_14200 [Acidimicrobiales bacterium]